jgi:hypothetical protein
VWKWVTGKNGKPTKPPYQGHAPEQFASSTDPATWSAIDVCMEAYCAEKCDGIGFALHGSAVGAFDIDHCRNADSGALHPWADELIQRCNSYAEVTPSRTGVRIIGIASGPALHRKFAVPRANGVSVEIYRNAQRYITITGVQIGDVFKLANIDTQADAIAAQLGGKTESNGRDLEALIRDGCGGDFGGDRSRAVWYVIHQLLKQGRPADEIVAVLLERGNGISAHIYDQKHPEAYVQRQVEKAQGERAEDSSCDAEIKRLAELNPVQYERERKAAAERLGIRAATLDKLVQAERPDDDTKQGRAVSFPDPELWPEPVNGAALLGSIAEAIRHYVILSDHSRDAAALWAIHTYLIDCFLVSPRLAICSPTKQCGKTTLLDVLGYLVLKPLPTANVTASAIFRVVEAYRPALLVDEADTFLRENDELRGIINSGHRHGGSVLRAVGEDYEPRAFSTYSACAIALIGKLPDTLHDRAVMIGLKRRLPSETITPFRADRVGQLDALARQAARWCRDHADEVANADPAMPAGIYNREADNWRPLLAIAEAAGGQWPERARQALEQNHANAADDSRLALLLGDIKAIFVEKDTDKVGSTALAEALQAIEGRPWEEYGKKNRKPISQNQLANLLKPIGIAPEVLREGKKTARGYQLAQFAEAFERYLCPGGIPDRNTVTNAMNTGTFGTFQTVTPEANVTVQKCEKSNNDGLCYGVTVWNGGNGESEQWDAEFTEAKAFELLKRRAHTRRVCRDHGWPIGEEEGAAVDSGNGPERPVAHLSDWQKAQCEKVWARLSPDEQDLLATWRKDQGLFDRPAPRVCQHCGAPEQPDSPVLSCWVEGEEYLLHAGCQSEWLGDDLPIPDFLRRVPTDGV